MKLVNDGHIVRDAAMKGLQKTSPAKTSSDSNEKSGNNFAEQVG